MKKLCTTMDFFVLGMYNEENCCLEKQSSDNDVILSEAAVGREVEESALFHRFYGETDPSTLLRLRSGSLRMTPYFRASFIV